MLKAGPGISHPQRAFRNVGGCFSDYFIFEVLRGRRYEGLIDPEGAEEARRLLSKTWRDAERRLSAGASLRRTQYFWYRPLLEALRMKPHATFGPPLDDGRPLPVQFELRNGREPLALLDLQPFGIDPDRDPHPGRDDPVDLGVVLSMEKRGVSWAYLFAGRLARIYRSGLGITRSYLEVDFAALCDNDDPAEWEVFWNLFRFDALSSGFLDRVGEESHVFAARVADDLRESALSALQAFAQGYLDCSSNRGRSNAIAEALHREALFLLYRLLFILYAESRDLLPLSNPLYRDTYSLHHLRNLAEKGDPPPHGTYFWDSLQSLFNLVGSGTRSSELALPPYNGRLFDVNHTPLFRNARIYDPWVRRGILALSLATSPGGGESGRERMSYEQLGIAQLGSIYEGLLAYEPTIVGEASHRRFRLLGGGSRRKASGAFYTPEAFTALLVRKTLESCVRGRSSQEILSLKVLDPAMGSGAFLIQAARFLGEAYGRALVKEGRGKTPVDEETLAEHKRLVAENCLYGVDLLPMAVDLAKVSLWLETASSGKPLTFLDHRLRSGDSLIGADLQPGPKGYAEIDFVPSPLLSGAKARVDRAERRDLLAGQLTLFGPANLHPILERFAEDRRALDVPEETPEDVTRKENLYKALCGKSSEVGRLKRICDDWCRLWFPEDPDRPLSTTSEFRRACEVILHGKADGEEAHTAISDAASARRFFHWELEFPEVFAGSRGGFDAILGNPPWEVIKPNRSEFFSSGGEGDRAREAAFAEEERRIREASLFFRRSGKYLHQGRGDLNTYKLFLERIYGLLAPGGRFGVIVPSGFYTDQGAAPLRRFYLDACRLEGVIGFENRDKIFPIDERYKFALLYGVKGKSTESFDALFMLRHLATLLENTRKPLRYRRSFLQEFSGEDLALPECRSDRELKILKKISRANSSRGSADGGAPFALHTELHIGADRDRIRPIENASGTPGRVRLHLIREIDASEKQRIRPRGKRRGAPYLPLIQGRCIHQFRADFSKPRLEVPASF
ncbi:MAG: Eco57I restriction-modification methylase domain-containing protein, partial [Planctomycetota bacterium]